MEKTKTTRKNPEGKDRERPSAPSPATLAVKCEENDQPPHPRKYTREIRAGPKTKPECLARRCGKGPFWSIPSCTHAPLSCPSYCYCYAAAELPRLLAQRCGPRAPPAAAAASSRGPPCLHRGVGALVNGQRSDVAAASPEVRAPSRCPHPPHVRKPGGNSGRNSAPFATGEASRATRIPRC